MLMDMDRAKNEKKMNHMEKGSHIQWNNIVNTDQLNLGLV